MDEAVFPAVSVEPYTTLVKDMEAYRLGVARVNVTLANLAEERQRILDAGRELGWKTRPLAGALPIPNAEDVPTEEPEKATQQEQDPDFAEVDDAREPEAGAFHLRPVPGIDAVDVRKRAPMFADGDDDA